MAPVGIATRATPPLELSDGNQGAAYISLVGDFATFTGFGVVAQTGKVAQGLRVLTISGNLAVATYDGFKAYEHWQADENGAAAGYVGLAFLNLLGAGLDARAMAKSAATRGLGTAAGQADRSILSKLDDGIPNTGVGMLDAPAIESRSFAQKMDAIRELRYDVIEDAKFLSRGEFDYKAMTFTYNPSTMTRLDLAHEWRHYKQLVRLRKAELGIRAKGVAAMEVGAYRFEQRLWQRGGLNPSDDYLRFHFDQTSQYLDEMHINRRWLRFHPQYGRIFQ